jgi:hypothetical protein
MRVKILSITLAALALCLFGPTAVASATAPLSFQVTIDPSLGASAPAGGYDGRVYVCITDTDPADPDWGGEPRVQANANWGFSAPVYGLDVDGIQPGHAVTLADDPSKTYPDGVWGYPKHTIAELPDGHYWVQAYVNVYHTYHRADGFALKLPYPAGNGVYNELNMTGGLYGPTIELDITQDSGAIALTVDAVVPQDDHSEAVPAGGTSQQGNPADSAHVKHVKIRSKLLSQFWGEDMYIAADILLPSGWDKKNNARRKYPAAYWTFHYPTRNPCGFVEPPGVQKEGKNWFFGDARFSDWWLSGDAPQMVVIQLRTENPYGEVSQQADSPNMGPWDSAAWQELIPELQKRFRLYNAGWARSVFGWSTGGWMATNQMLEHPEKYAGAWAYAPDILSFDAFPYLNLYDARNAYWTDYGWTTIPVPSYSSPDGVPEGLMYQDYGFESVLHTHLRGYGYASYSFGTWCPPGADGYTAPAWDMTTGKIDHSVTDYMAANWDMTKKVVREWPAEGRQLRGKLHLYVGYTDGGLEYPFKRFQSAVQGLKNPRADAQFVISPVAGHAVPRPNGMLGQIREMARTMKAAAPGKAKTWWFR